MKKLILFAIVFFISIYNINAKPVDISVNFGFFYSSLEPYGEWIVLDDDLFVWRPVHMDRHWRPYSHGRWSWTRYGWYWDSYEPFGWAVYHYGRWYYDDYYGWVWIPDYEWGPAWVEWRYDDVYVGWAPLPPYAHFRIDIGIHFSISWHSHYSYWNFVAYDHFCHDRLNYYIVGSHLNHRIFERTKYRNNYSYDRGRIVNGGLDRKFVEKRAGYRIAERDIYDVDRHDKYERDRKADRDKIYNYRPSEREIEKYSANRKIEVSRGDRKLSIDRDKIVYKNDLSYKEKESISIRNRSDNRENIKRENIPNKDFRENKEDRTDNETIRESNKRSISSDGNSERSRTEVKPEVRSKESSRYYESKRDNDTRRKESSVNRSKTSERNNKSEKSSTGRKVERRR
ncbi:MAG: DUF6600 domain-containing protein [Bacteroidota bacterium]